MALFVGGTELTGGGSGVETGTIVSWSNSTIPSGFLECDGSAVSRTTYSALFAIISTDYGSGDGSSTFNLPNMQDKTTVGASSGKAYSTTGGAESVSVSNHTLSSSQMPQHRHTSQKSRYAAGTGWYGTYSQQLSPGTQYSNYQGSSSSHNHGSMSVMQPYMALKFMIKT